LHDVLDRIRGAAEEHSFDPVIRVSADSPFIDSRIIKRVLEEFQSRATAGEPTISTNIFPRTFPKGQSVEVVSGSALELLHSRAHDPLDREHVTSYAYKNPDQFQIINVYNSINESEQNMCIDSLDDLERAKKSILKRL
jgi:spore coat polysaccharide biosynthesis protein SpsF (cytidylyltransferase family)